MQTRIKSYADGNQYIRTPQGMWVRNFTNLKQKYKNINKTYNRQDFFTFLKNEVQNSMQRFSWIENENFLHETVVIVSDGYDFENKQKLLEKIPKNVTLIGVLGSLSKWNIKRSLDYYLVNNPYETCMKYFNRRMRAMPKCIASLKTDSNFLMNYRGLVYKYLPVYEEEYKSKYIKEVSLQVDDYRNPICAAIHFSFLFGSSKVFLFCCDDSFSGERPAAEKLENGLYQYPQQKIAHDLIDAKMYWLNKIKYQEIDIFDHSSGSVYNNATYISEEQFLERCN